MDIPNEFKRAYFTFILFSFKSVEKIFVPEIRLGNDSGINDRNG
jgi:hypothetical protein